VSGSLAQEKKETRKHSKQAFEELEDAQLEYEEGKLRLWFNDAVTGMPIEGAAIRIEGIGNFITDSRGTVIFPIPEDGTYIVSFRKNNYIPSDFTIEIDAGTIFTNNHFSVSPEMDLKFVRIVLNWGKRPKDLDLHLVKKNVYHISYRDMRTANDGTAVLDRDDRNSYGPETITITEIDPNGEYECFVHDYSHRGNRDSKKLGKSRATVRVFAKGKLLYTFKVPPYIKGDTWKVFRIVDGEIKKISFATR
jgi:hypothetical protein